ncbi:MAG TPA: aminotransferase class IV [Candidatus Acidoferrales bacterium]|nr:aminotransferase class IV [Candidatus Acidoferrales bacterium]
MNRLPPYVCLNGRFVAASRARVSVFDRGLLYGDGLFETVRSYSGRLFALDDHLARLHQSADFLRLRVPNRAWRNDIERLLRRCRLDKSDAAVRITVTRGPAAPGLLPPSRPVPTVLIVATPIAATVARDQQHGINVALLPFGRTGLLAEHKTLDYLPAILGRIYAQEHGACDALYVDRGCLSEATTANLFVVRDGQLFTPPVSALLPGVTRKWVLEAARLEGVKVRERPIRKAVLAESDEAFLTSSVVEVMPLIRTTEFVVGTGRVGALTKRIQRRYRHMIDTALSLRASP